MAVAVVWARVREWSSFQPPLELLPSAFDAASDKHKVGKDVAVAPLGGGAGRPGWAGGRCDVVDAAATAGFLAAAAFLAGGAAFLAAGLARDFFGGGASSDSLTSDDSEASSSSDESDGLLLRVLVLLARRSRASWAWPVAPRARRRRRRRVVVAYARASGRAAEAAFTSLVARRSSSSHLVRGILQCVAFGVVLRSLLEIVIERFFDDALALRARGSEGRRRMSYWKVCV